MAQVPSNLIPTTVTQLPDAPVADENSLMMIVYQGVNYKIRVGDLLSVAGVPVTRQVIAGTGLQGGGQLSSNVTLSIAPGGVGNSELSQTGVTPGVYGTSSFIPVLTVDAQGRVAAASTTPVASSAGGTVVSVGLSLPGEFSVSGSPVTYTGTLAGSWNSQTANYVFAAPDGSSGVPSFRALTNTDIPAALSGKTITSSTVDGSIIGGSTPAAGTFTTATATDVNATTVDSTNLEVTNLKAKDGAAAGSIANTTGVVTLNSAVLTTADINGGTIDGTTIGGTTPAAGTFTSVDAEYVDFAPALSPLPTDATGRVYYDNNDQFQTLAFQMNGSVVQHVGEEIFFRIKCQGAITKGQVVMFAGTLGASGGLIGAAATGLTPLQANYILGVADESGLNNEWIFVTQFGEVRNVNTTGGAEAWVQGQELYYNPAVTGGLTKNKPTAPNAIATVAAVVHVGTSNGILFVRPTFGSVLGGTDGNVQFGTLNNGDVIIYDGVDQRWENVAQSTLSVGTTTNLAGGTTGSVPYQSTVGSTTFLSIGAADRVLTSSGTAPQWVTSLTGLTINNSVIGGSTPAAATFTTLTGNSTSQFGRASDNYFQAIGAAANLTPEIAVLGSDTNIPFTIESKGTGAINLSAGSRGVNVANGQTVTAITRTAAGSNYTSVPSVAISAPTTAGGVQATATALVFASGVTIQSGGTGYSLNDVLTVTGGTFTTAAQLTVSSVSGGVITGVTISTAGSYSVTPANPVSVTGGTGAAATFNLTYGVTTTFTITNAGSGYVEQPTVTFSGGGGAGAAAYATVGSFTTIKSIGAGTSGSVTNTGFIFQTPNTVAPSFIIREASGADSYLIVNPQVAYANLVALGASNANLGIFANGAGRVGIGTSGTSNVEQLRVSHTASAVNYVQVTGAATTTNPTISAQGSDTNIGLSFATKGSFGMQFNNASGGTIVQYTQTGAVSATTNFLRFTNFNGSGAAPVISAQGGDTNIDLALTPKGTGAVKTSAAVVATGGISGGTF